jgi:hypothetical protein
MKNFRQVYEQMNESVFFMIRKRIRKSLNHPEIREVYEDYIKRKRGEYENVIDKELKNIKKLQQSYEYKVFEHYKKTDLLSNKKASFFIKYCKFDYMKDKSKWGNKPFHINTFDSPQDYIKTAFTYFLYFALGIFFLKIGFYNGKKDSILYDVVRENVTDIRTEDQLFDILLKNNKPLLIMYYYPGAPKVQDMMFAMGDFIEKNGDIVNMAKVNCKYNVDLCLKKAQMLIMPQWELMLQSYEAQEGDQVVKKFPVIPSKMDKSLEGIEGFLIQQGVMEDKYSPIDMIEKAMRKF